MSKVQLKSTVTNLIPEIKGSERNVIKNFSYLTSNYSDIGTMFFMSSKLGRTLTTLIGQIAEGIFGVGVSHVSKGGT